MVLPTPTSLALTLLVTSPFQWFTVAGAKPSGFRASAIRAPPWAGQHPTPGALGATLSVLSLALYEWARSTVAGRRFNIALAGEVPDAVCESGPYRYIRHPFYLSYVIAFLGMLVATATLVAAMVFLSDCVGIVNSRG